MAVQNTALLLEKSRKLHAKQGNAPALETHTHSRRVRALPSTHQGLEVTAVVARKYPSQRLHRSRARDARSLARSHARTQVVREGRGGDGKVRQNEESASREKVRKDQGGSPSLRGGKGEEGGVGERRG